MSASQLMLKRSDLERIIQLARDKDFVLLHLEISGMNFSTTSYELVEKQDYERIKRHSDIEFSFGYIGGKHADITRTFDEIIVKVIDDPDDIYQVLKVNGDEDRGFTELVLEQIDDEEPPRKKRNIDNSDEDDSSDEEQEDEDLVPCNSEGCNAEVNRFENIKKCAICGLLYCTDCAFVKGGYLDEEDEKDLIYEETKDSPDTCGYWACEYCWERRGGDKGTITATEE